MVPSEITFLQFIRRPAASKMKYPQYGHSAHAEAKRPVLYPHEVMSTPNIASGDRDATGAKASPDYWQKLTASNCAYSLPAVVQ
jgi:hypothetical protein